MIRSGTSLVFLAVLAFATVPAHAQILEEHKKRVVVGDDLVCTFKVITEAIYEKTKIMHDKPAKQSEPLVFSFTGLTTNTPKLRALGAAGTTYESSDLISVGNKEKVVLIKITPAERNVFVYTIYREHGVALWTKHYTTLFTEDPIGTVAMGECQ